MLGVAIQTAHTPLTKYSFVVFIAANALWIADGIYMRNRPLVFKNIFLSALNIIAVIRWFT